MHLPSYVHTRFRSLHYHALPYCTHTCTHANAHTHIYACVHACTGTHTHTHILTCTAPNIKAQARTHTHTQSLAHPTYEHTHIHTHTTLQHTSAGALADLVRTTTRINRLDITHCTLSKHHQVEATTGIARALGANSSLTTLTFVGNGGYVGNDGLEETVGLQKTVGWRKRVPLSCFCLWLREYPQALILRLARALGADYSLVCAGTFKSNIKSAYVKCKRGRKRVEPR